MNRRPKIIHLTSNVIQIILGGVNAFLIQSHNGWVLIDTGYPGTIELLRSSLDRLGLKIPDIQHIVLTHLHPDHTGELAQIKAISQATVWMHEQDAALIEQGVVFRSPIQVTPGWINKIVYNRNIKPGPYELPPTTIDEFLSDNDPLPFMKSAKVIHSPGHAKGHICLLLEEESCLIAGDICVNVLRLTYPPIYEDLHQMKESIKMVANYSFEVAGFGHGRPILKKASHAIRALSKK